MSPSETPPVILRSGGAEVWLLPWRGAIVSRWRARARARAHARDVLYLDEATLADPAKNVRGGIPLLFPSPGKLENGRFARDGKSGEMKQHGFARDLPWRVVEVGESAARLELSSTAATHAQFDWSFKLALRVLLTESRLRLEVRVENTGSEPMPCAFGTHPYFLVHDKAQARISTQATRAFDNVTGQVVPFKGFDLAHGETDLHLLDHGASESTLSADGHAVTVRGSPEFVRWVVWTQPGKDFVCLEPWTAPGNALNTGESLLHVAPNEAPELWLELEAS